MGKASRTVITRAAADQRIEIDDLEKTILENSQVKCVSLDNHIRQRLKGSPLSNGDYLKDR